MSTFRVINTTGGGGATIPTVIGEVGSSNALEASYVSDARRHNVELVSNIDPDFGDASGIVYIQNATQEPDTDPTSGGFLYVLDGNLYFIGSGGTLTKIAES